MQLTSVLGAVLGVFCRHRYAHNTDIARHRLPEALKGVDLAIYLAFQALGLRVSVKPIIDRDGHGGVSLAHLRANKHLEVSQSAQKKLQSFQEDDNSEIRLEYEGEDLTESGSKKHICRARSSRTRISGLDLHLERLKRRRVKGLTTRYRTGTQVTVGTRFAKTAFLEGDCFDTVGHCPLTLQSRADLCLLNRSWTPVGLT